MINRFNPLTVLSSTIGGTAVFTGLLEKLIRMDGTVEQAAEKLDEGIDFLDPLPGKRYLLRTRPQ